MNNPLIAFITDIHFSHSGHSHEKFSKQMEFFEKQFFPYLIDNKIKYVMNMGDFYHDRSRADWFILSQIKKRFFQWFDDNDVEFHTILGNHDLQFKNTLEHNSLSETTKAFKNVFVYSEPTKIKIEKYTIGLEPWIIDHKNHKLLDKVDILLLHTDIKGFDMMKGISCREGFSVSDFENYKLVLSGHFHLRTIKYNFHMVGSPFQLNWGDCDQSRGFCVIDDSFNIEYIENEINPRYVKIYYDNGILVQEGLKIDKNITEVVALDIVKNNYCRLLTKTVSDQMALDTFHTSLLNASIDDYKIEVVSLQDTIESFDDTSFDDSFAQGESTLQLITKSIEGMVFESGIDKDMLIEFSKMEYKEAYQEAISIGVN